MALACQPASAADKPSGDVMRVRLGGDAHRTRIVVELDKSTAGQLVTRDDDARTAVIALPNVDLDKSMSGTGQGLVSGWKLDSLAGSVRLHINYAAAARVQGRFLLPPADGVSAYRYVIDLVPANGPAPDAVADLLASIGTSPAQDSNTAPVETAAERIHAKKIIVIDAGHGGKDPGSLGANVYEKDVTLAAAKALKERLERTGRFQVVLTRETDTFIPLESRVQIARRADADLFISLHADSGPDTSTRGASVYTLSEKGTERVGRVLEKDDWLMKANMPGRDRAVSQILLDLSQRATKNRSAAFAQLLLANVGEETSLLRRSHRDAGFIVLLAPDVPAVLLEMGFITNPEDEAFLTTKSSRARLVNAVGDSIEAYFSAGLRKS
jgi:N-acetylmuramoyl-L-alanine amidase